MSLPFTPSGQPEQPPQRSALLRGQDQLDQFLYAITHDFKANLRAIHEIPNWIEEDLVAQFQAVPASVREDLDLMRQAARTLSVMLDGLTDISRVGRLAGEPRVVPVSELAQACWARLEDRQGFTLDVTDADLAVAGPEKDLERLFGALLGNGVHHHDKTSGTLRVKAREEGARVTIHVTDDGPGIEAQYREKVFQPLFLLRRREETGRAGLGLTLARSVVESLGGQIRLDSNSETQGLTAVFDLPSQLPAATA